jgi:hypothetical protein
MLYEPLTDDQRERFLRTPELLMGTWWCDPLNEVYRVYWVNRKGQARLFKQSNLGLYVVLRAKHLIREYSYLGTDQLIRRIEPRAYFQYNRNLVEVLNSPISGSFHVIYRQVRNTFEHMARDDESNGIHNIGLVNFLRNACETPMPSKTRDFRYDTTIPFERRQAAYRILYPEEFPVESASKVIEGPLKSRWQHLLEDGDYVEESKE